jgi:hypothetical protein
MQRALGGGRLNEFFFAVAPALPLAPLEAEGQDDADAHPIKLRYRCVVVPGASSVCRVSPRGAAACSRTCGIRVASLFGRSAPVAACPCGPLTVDPFILSIEALVMHLS